MHVKGIRKSANHFRTACPAGRVITTSLSLGGAAQPVSVAANVASSPSVAVERTVSFPIAED